MHSIRARITLLTVSAILISSILIGTISIFTVKSFEEQNSKELLNTICESRCDKINNYLHSIEDSVATLHRYVYDSIDVVPLYEANVIGATGSGRSLSRQPRTAKQQAALDSYLRAHVEASLAVFETIASNNTSIVSYFYRVNPEFSATEKGFWFAKVNGMRFREMEMTDISDYSPDDFAHVGWYYLPLERGCPSWLPPYENANLGEMVVSYIIPLYRYGTFIGEIGLDISYSTLIDQIHELQVMQTGYAFLTDEKGKILYHPELESGVLLSDINSELNTAESSGMTLTQYTFDGVLREAAWRSLSNNMRLIVSVPISETNAGWRNMTSLVLTTAITTITIFIALTLWLVRKITDPLSQLVKASSQISAGDYNVDLPYHGNDEIGILTKSFQQMANHIRVFIKDLNSKAFRDSLTGVRNASAFEVMQIELDEIIDQFSVHKDEAFGIMMFDCNSLKKINDTYGHDKGDIYLQQACSLICSVYAHSPVFRIGGDEFVVILKGEDLERHIELEQTFEARSQNINAKMKEEWEQIDISRGTAVFDPEVDEDVESVLRRADEFMYEDKKKRKAAKKK